jgi:hypothetical protein
MSTIKIEAITKRQRAIEKALRPLRKFMNMAAVPKSIPAVIPSKSAIFLFLFSNLSSTLV